MLKFCDWFFFMFLLLLGIQAGATSICFQTITAKRKAKPIFLLLAFGE